MTQNEWSEEFEKALRPHLPYLESSEKLNPDTPLVDMGLDSISTVNLLIDLEQELEVSVPDEMLTGETFSTVFSLWSVINKLSP